MLSTLRHQTLFGRLTRRTTIRSHLIYVRPTVSTQSSSTNIAACSSVLMLCPHRLEQSSHILYTLLTVSLVLGLSSRLTCSQDICSRFTVCASDTLTGSFERYNLVTYLLNKHNDGLRVQARQPLPTRHTPHTHIVAAGRWLHGKCVSQHYITTSLG